MLVVISGLPAVGKTTVLRKLSAMWGFRVASFDTFRTQALADLSKDQDSKHRLPDPALRFRSAVDFARFQCDCGTLLLSSFLKSAERQSGVVPVLVEINPWVAYRIQNAFPAIWLFRNRKEMSCNLAKRYGASQHEAVRILQFFESALPFAEVDYRCWRCIDVSLGPECIELTVLLHVRKILHSRRA